MLVRDVTAKGVRVRLVEAGDGPAVVLVHGFLGSHADFSSVLSRLATRYRVVAPDLPGFGDSEKPDPQRYAYGYPAFAEAVADVIAALGLGRVGLLGHGMGAGVALTLASTSPSLVRALVLSCPLVHAGTDGFLDRVAGVPVLGGLVWRQMLGARSLRRYVMSTTYASSPRVHEERLHATTEALFEPAARHAAHATLSATRDRRPLVALLPRVDTPSLVVWGQDDARALTEHGRRLARELGARLEAVPGGRAVPMDAPEALAEIAEEFFAPPPPAKRARSRASTP